MLLLLSLGAAAAQRLSASPSSHVPCTTATFLIIGRRSSGNLGLDKEIGVVAIAEDADIVDHLQQWRKSAPPGTYRRVAQSKNSVAARGELECLHGRLREA